jgi:excisionase family DNA binding protein
MMTTKPHGETRARGKIERLDEQTLDLEHNPANLTLSVPQAGQLLRLGRSQAYEAAARGEIPTLRFGRSLRVPKAKLRRMLGLEI